MLDKEECYEKYINSEHSLEIDLFANPEHYPVLAHIIDREIAKNHVKKIVLSTVKRLNDNDNVVVQVFLINKNNKALTGEGIAGSIVIGRIDFSSCDYSSKEAFKASMFSVKRKLKRRYKTINQISRLFWDQ